MMRRTQTLVLGLALAVIVSLIMIDKLNMASQPDKTPFNLLCFIDDTVSFEWSGIIEMRESNGTVTVDTGELTGYYRMSEHEQCYGTTVDVKGMTP